MCLHASIVRTREKRHEQSGARAWGQGGAALGWTWRYQRGVHWSAVVTADFDDGNAKYDHFGEAEGNRRGDGAV